jgi:hypothetical protein
MAELLDVRVQDFFVDVRWLLRLEWNKDWKQTHGGFFVLISNRAIEGFIRTGKCGTKVISHTSLKLAGKHRWNHASSSSAKPRS